MARYTARGYGLRSVPIMGAQIGALIATQLPEEGLTAGFDLGAIVGGVVSARLANTYSEQKLARVAGSILVVFRGTMTIIQFTGVGVIINW